MRSAPCSLDESGGGGRLLRLTGMLVGLAVVLYGCVRCLRPVLGASRTPTLLRSLGDLSRGSGFLLHQITQEVNIALLAAAVGATITDDGVVRSRRAPCTLNDLSLIHI